MNGQVVEISKNGRLGWRSTILYPFQVIVKIPSVAAIAVHPESASPSWKRRFC
jgi:hypothetical protein